MSEMNQTDTTREHAVAGIVTGADVDDDAAVRPAVAEAGHEVAR